MRFLPRPSTPFGRTLRNVGWLLTGKGVAAVLSIGYLALATRTLGVAGFGNFMLILSTAQAVAAIAGFQTWQLVVRFGVAHAGPEGAPRLARLIRFAVAVDAGGALAGCGIAAAALVLMGRHMGWTPALTRDAFLFSAVLLLSIRSTAVGVLRLHDRFATGAGADSVTFLTRFAGAVVAAACGAGVTGFLIAWATAEVATAVAYWLAVVRTVPGLFAGRRGIRAAPGENPGLWRYLFASNANSALTVTSRQLVVVLVGLMTGAAAAGGYRLAYQLSQSLVRLSDMFARGLFPEIARSASETSPAGLRRLMRQSARLAIAVGLATVILVPVLGKPVLLLVAGKSYLGAYPVLVLLGVAAGADIMAAGFEPVLLGVGRIRAALAIRAGSAAMLFAGLALFVPRWGVTGAGFAALAASTLALALLMVRVRALARDADRRDA